MPALRASRSLIVPPSGASLPPGMEVVNRAVTGADGDAVGSRDGGGDVVLGSAHSGAEVLALGEAGRDRGREGAAGAVGVAGGDPRRREPGLAVRLDQQVDAFGA